MTQPLKLTDEQRERIAANPDMPTRCIDPTTDQEYVIVRAEDYDRLSIDWGEFRVEDAYGAVNEVFAEDWNHPSMDVYDNYEENLKKLRGEN